MAEEKPDGEYSVYDQAQDAISATTVDADVSQDRIEE